MNGNPDQDTTGNVLQFTVKAEPPALVVSRPVEVEVLAMLWAFT